MNEANGVHRIELICPIGKSRRAANQVHPFGEKYFASHFGRHSISDSSRPASTRGRMRYRHET
jgi:hypothetical protein